MWAFFGTQCIQSSVGAWGKMCIKPWRWHDNPAWRGLNVWRTYWRCDVVGPGQRGWGCSSVENCRTFLFSCMLLPVMHENFMLQNSVLKIHFLIWTHILMLLPDFLRPVRQSRFWSVLQHAPELSLFTSRRGHPYNLPDCSTNVYKKSLVVRSLYGFI